MSTKQYPAVTGLNWRHGEHYAFYIPKDWYRFAWADEREGEIHGPDQNDPHTIFAVDTQDTGMDITAEDLDALAEGFFESVNALPGVEIESRKQRATGRMLEIEAKYSFKDAGETRKRWVRLFYYGPYQINMVAQGATPETYDYWLPWFFEAMMTAKVYMKAPQSPFD